MEDADGETSPMAGKIFSFAKCLQRCESDLSADYFTYIHSFQVFYSIKTIIILYL